MVNLELQRLTAAIGATIEGIDLSRALTPPLKAALEAALVEHQVLFFQGQELEPKSQRAFALSWLP